MGDTKLGSSRRSDWKSGKWVSGTFKQCALSKIWNALWLSVAFSHSALNLLLTCFWCSRWTPETQCLVNDLGWAMSRSRGKSHQERKCSAWTQSIDSWCFWHWMDWMHSHAIFKLTVVTMQKIRLLRWVFPVAMVRLSVLMFGIIFFDRFDGSLLQKNMIQLPSEGIDTHWILIGLNRFWR